MRCDEVRFLERTIVIVRWVARATYRPLLLHLLPQWTLLAVVLVEADAIVDVNLLRAELTAAPAWACALFVSGVSALMAWSERRFVGDLLVGPRHAVLRRQPIPEWAWGPASLPVLAPLGAPLGVFAAFWYGPWALPSVLGWSACLWLPAALMSTGRPLLGLLASALVGALCGLGHSHGALSWMPLMGGLLSVPLVGVLVARAPLLPGRPPGLEGPRPRGVISALVLRDLTALWRLERGLLGGALGAGLLAGLVARAAHVNGEYPGPVLVRFPLTCLLLTGPLALGALTAAARHCGRSFDPPHWPVRVWQRAAALALVAALVLTPGWAAAAVAAPPLGLDGHLRIGLFVALVGAGAAWWVASRPAQPGVGSWPYWLAVSLAAAVWRPGPLLGVLLGALAFWRASVALEKRRGHL
jgi:hypothetical protein